MNDDIPFPVEGTIVPEDTGHIAKFPCDPVWFRETENGDILQAAVDRAAREYGNDVEVRVRFTADPTGFQCGGFELIGPVDDEEGSA